MAASPQLLGRPTGDFHQTEESSSLTLTLFSRGCWATVLDQQPMKHRVHVDLLCRNKFSPTLCCCSLKMGSACPRAPGNFVNKSRRSSKLKRCIGLRLGDAHKPRCSCTSCLNGKCKRNRTASHIPTILMWPRGGSMQSSDLKAAAKLYCACAPQHHTGLAASGTLWTNLVITSPRITNVHHFNSLQQTVKYRNHHLSQCKPTIYNILKRDRSHTMSVFSQQEVNPQASGSISPNNLIETYFKKWENYNCLCE